MQRVNLIYFDELKNTFGSFKIHLKVISITQILFRALK